MAISSYAILTSLFWSEGSPGLNWFCIKSRAGSAFIQQESFNTPSILGDSLILRAAMFLLACENANAATKMNMKRVGVRFILRLQITYLNKGFYPPIWRVLRVRRLCWYLFPPRTKVRG